MKNTAIVIVFILSMGAIFSAYRNGPANRGHDKTGSPLSNGKCLDCHSSGSFSPSLSIKAFDGDLEVNSYEPGKKYMLQYQLINTGSPAGFGFQTVVLSGTEESTGSFGEEPNGFQKIEFEGATYIEHSSPVPLSTFEIEWTAPEDANDAITIYAGSVAANGNGNTGGDGADVDELVLQPNTSATDNQVHSTHELFELNSTLVNENLQIDLSVNNSKSIFLVINSSGQILSEEQIAGNLDKLVTISVSNLQSGMYFIQCIQERRMQSKRFYKL